MLCIDNTFDDLPVSDRKQQRQLVLSEKIDAYFTWVKQKYAQVAQNSSIGKAFAYSINQEKYLRVFLADGNIPMNNNYAEQAIRPFTLESSNEVKASAVLYSLVETAKANGLNTFEYFNLLLSDIPLHVDESNLSFLDDLLPGHPEHKKHVLVNIINLNFSRYNLFPQNQYNFWKHGDFCLSGPHV